MNEWMDELFCFVLFFFTNIFPSLIHFFFFNGNAGKMHFVLRLLLLKRL